MHLFVLRLERDCSTRTYICASSALGANVRINGIVFAFRNSTHRALINTRTARDTIGWNFVSHKTIYDLVIYHLVIYFLILPFCHLALQNYCFFLTLPNFRDIFFWIFRKFRKIRSIRSVRKLLFLDTRQRGCELGGGTCETFVRQPFPLGVSRPIFCPSFGDRHP